MVWMHDRSFLSVSGDNQSVIWKCDVYTGMMQDWKVQECLSSQTSEN